jgi:hypothetical protein
VDIAGWVPADRKVPAGGKFCRGRITPTLGCVRQPDRNLLPSGVAGGRSEVGSGGSDLSMVISRGTTEARGPRGVKIVSGSATGDGATGVSPLLSG